MSVLNVLSLILEVLLVFLGLKIALSNKKAIGWLISLTFLIYVVYDSSRFFSISLPFHNFLFFIASISIFFAVWSLSKEK